MTTSGSVVCVALILDFDACAAEFRIITSILENIVITGPMRRCNGAGECYDFSRR